MSEEKKVVPNQEHFEAHQKEVDEHRYKQLAKLDSKTRELILEVEALSQKLTDNNMPHIMFVDDKTSPESYNFYQYNLSTKQKHEDIYHKDALKEGVKFVEDFALAAFSWISKTGVLQLCMIARPTEDGKLSSLKTKYFDALHKFTLE